MKWRGRLSGPWLPGASDATGTGAFEPGRREFLKSVGPSALVASGILFGHPAVAQGAPRGLSDFGHRYVDFGNGDDRNSGLSPAAAKKTIQAAHDDLATTGPPRMNGGTIWLARGQHVINDVEISNDGTRIIGAGVWATELMVNRGGSDGLRFTGESCYLSDLQITDRSNRSDSGTGGRYAIYVDGGQESVFERLFINGWADNYSGPNGFDVEPTAIFIEGVSSFGDWLELRHIRTRGNYSGLKLSSGTNGWVDHCVFSGTRQTVWIKRRDREVGRAVSWRFLECQWLGGPEDDFSVRCESDTDSWQGRIHFTSCLLEISAATSPSSGYYSDLSDTIIMGGHLGAAGMQPGQKAIHLGPHAVGSVVGPYTEDGLSLPGAFQDDGDASWWRPNNLGF